MQSLEIARHMAIAAMDAWEEVKDDPERHRVVTRGADGTATSLADQHLDNAMLKAAEEMDIDVLSEETGRVGNRGGPLAVIDPLDGSRNAGRGIPAYCTSVAIGQTGIHDIEASVVINLATGDAFEASPEGSMFNGNLVRPGEHNPKEMMVAIIGDQPDVEMLLSMHKHGLHMRDLGSAALELCLVGTGALDAFHVPQSWLRVIDIAGGVYFVRQAGGAVLDPATKEDLQMPFDLETRRGVMAVRHESMLGALV